MKLDEMSAVEIVRLMTHEEQQVLVALEAAEDAIAQTAAKVAEAFLAGGRTIYFGAGTSGRLATLDASEMVPTFGTNPEQFVSVMAGGIQALGKAAEANEDDADAASQSCDDLRLTSADLVIGIAASGTTKFVCAAVETAHSKGCWTCGIANNSPSKLLEISDLAIFLDTGPEIITGSTRLKAGTAQKLVLNRISTTAMILAGKTISNLMVDVRPSNEKLRERCVRILVELTGLDESVARERLVRADFNIRAALKDQSG